MNRRALARAITVKDMASLAAVGGEGFVPADAAPRGLGRYRFRRLVSLGLLVSSGDALFPGCQPQTYTLTPDSEHMTDFRKIGTAVLANGDRVDVLAGRYPRGGQAAIVLRDAATGAPYATLSTNLAGHGASLTPDAFSVKSWSENAPLIEPLRASGLFVDTGQRIASGFAEAQVWAIKDPAHVPPLPREHGKTRRHDRER